MSDLIARREAVLGPNVPTFYDDPVHIVRGEGVWLWDADGRKYLDCYNNVPHVGHCHPHVVEAIARQAATLNTHTRYLHEGVLEYGERIAATLSHEINQMIMVCTGSEANDIALRMAQAVTGHTGIIATDNTYHGNTAAVTQLSSRRPPIGGYAPHVRLVPAPNSVHPVGGTREGQAQAFADEIAKAIADLVANGFGFSGMMLCPSFANEGFPDLEPNFLTPAIKVIKEAGGLVLCDEVQPGFGRLGSHFWGHDAMGFAPDIVTLGKPMANGHPVAAVLTRANIMKAFRQAFGYFNTFGGNPVSAAAAMATLDVIENDHLQANAHNVGQHCLERLNAIKHPLKTQARGHGLFFGVEFSLGAAPATLFVTQLVEYMRQHGVLLNKIGRHGNTLKMRPPMPFSIQDADFALDLLEQALSEVPHGR
ncbi:MAG: aspartate aminotransferase family protein [Litoreibacter sp.]